MKKYFSFLALSILSVFFTFAQKSALLSGYLPQFLGDNVKCVLGSNSVIGQNQSLKIPVINKRFKQKIEIDGPTYLYVTDGENYIYGLVAPGDNVSIKLNTADLQNPLSFEGNGKEKFEFRNKFVATKIYKKLADQTVIARTKTHPFDYLFDFLDSTEIRMTQELDAIKNIISKESYAFLLADIKATFITNRNHGITTVYSETATTTLKIRQKELTPKSTKRIQEILNFENRYSYSTNYINSVYNILFRDCDSRVLANEMSNDLPTKYKYIESKLPVDLRNPVLTVFFEYDIGKLNSGNDLEELIKKTFSKATDSSYKNYISRKYKMAMDTGDFRKGVRAPDFVLENETGNKVNLSSFRGKVLYIDFWFEACGPCHALFSTLEATREHFLPDTNVVFLYVSVDRMEVWKKSLIKYPMKGYHVFTENRESEHPMIKAYKVKGFPTTCLIDRNGNIFNANPAQMPDDLQQQIEDALKVE